MNDSSAILIQCPHCKSKDITFKLKVELWECQECESRFTAPPPQNTIQSITDRAQRAINIFFSYGHDKNKSLVERFKSDLERRGHKVWLDTKEIGTWDDWRGKIVKGIDDSNLAIAFISKHSIRDPGVCINEIAIAMNRFGITYPVLLEANIEDRIPSTIANLQWPDFSLWQTIQNGEMANIDWKRWYEEKLLNLIDKLENDATPFSEETQILRTTLQPISFESKIERHVPNFIGRKWLFDAYTKWLEQQPHSRLFWIKAGPGIGKSAIAANMAHHHRGAVIASWFCDAKSNDLNNPATAIVSIAFQLALRWQDYRVKLLRVLGLDINSSKQDCLNIRASLKEKNYQDLFSTLLAEPMVGIIWREHKLVIVIDALDEATDEQGNNLITELISKEFTSLPKWVCFVVTSRPEADVVNRLQGFNAFEINAQDRHNLEDLKNWYHFKIETRTEFEPLSKEEKCSLKELIIARSAGMILYLKVIEEGLNEGSLSIDKLSSLEHGLPGLYRRYFDSFQQRFGANYEKHIKPLFRFLLIAQDPVPKDIACAALDINNEQFLQLQNTIGSYLIDSIAGLQIFHKTLKDWLTNTDSGCFYIDLKLGKKELGEFLWRHYQSSNIKLPFKWESQVQKWLPQFLPYTDYWNDDEHLLLFGKYLNLHQCFVFSRSILEQVIILREDLDSPNHKNITEGLDTLVLTCIQLADFGYITQAQSTADVLSSSSSEAVILSAQFLNAYCLRRQGSLIESQKWLNNYDVNAVSCLLPSLKLRIQYQAAHINHLLGQYDKACTIYGLIINTQDNIHQQQEARNLAHRQLADVCMLRGEFKKAHLEFTKCLSLVNNDTLWLLECRRFTAHVYRFNAMSDKAIELYENILYDCEKNGLSGLQGKILVNIAETYCWSNPQKAIKRAKESIKINQQISNKIEVGKAYTALALAYLFLNHHNKAIEQADKAEKIQIETGYQSGLAFNEGAKALIFLKSGNRARMKESLSKMDKITKSIGAYRFLYWFYSTICEGAKQPYDKVDFDWLEKDPIKKLINDLVQWMTQN